MHVWTYKTSHCDTITRAVVHTNHTYPIQTQSVLTSIHSTLSGKTTGTASGTLRRRLTINTLTHHNTRLPSNQTRRSSSLQRSWTVHSTHQSPQLYTCYWPMNFHCQHRPVTTCLHHSLICSNLLSGCRSREITDSDGTTAEDMWVENEPEETGCSRKSTESYKKWM